VRQAELGTNKFPSSRLLRHCAIRSGIGGRQVDHTSARVHAKVGTIIKLAGFFVFAPNVEKVTIVIVPLRCAWDARTTTSAAASRQRNKRYCGHQSDRNNR
jgi:hypothetical protein